MKKNRIFKFGGSSFPALESYHEIAQYLKQRLNEDTEKAVVVVSAMSGTTGRLLETGLKLNPKMTLEITDSLLATGEMVAACLMRSALDAIGVSTMHLTGYQVGIHSDSKYTRAEILAIDSSPILKCFHSCDIVVVAGGQATNTNGRLTMLGRNSSDLTAVALASALRLSECEIFSDVPGVYTADPYLIPEARLIKRISHDSVISMSTCGAKVLHHGSVRYAKNYGIRILCRGTKDKEIGTIIGSSHRAKTVVLNEKIIAMRFNSTAARDEVDLQFHTQGIISIKVEQAGPLLAVSMENQAYCEVLQQIKQDYEMLSNICLISVIHSDGKETYSLHPTINARTELRRIYFELYPKDFKNVGDSSDKSFANIKVRSVMSGLLVGCKSPFFENR